MAVSSGFNQRRYSNLNFKNRLLRTPAAGNEAVFCTQKLCHISELTINGISDTQPRTDLMLQCLGMSLDAFFKKDHRLGRVKQVCMPP